MAQIVTTKVHSDRCNLAAIRSGGSKSDIVLADGEVWLVDTTNSYKGNKGYGKYDSYIVGDGINKASVLPIKVIDDLSSKQDVLTFDETPSLDSTNPVTSHGIKDALNAKANAADTYTKSEVNSMISGSAMTPTTITVLTAEQWPPSTYSTNTIYRVAGDGVYTDYMYNGTTVIKLAEYSNQIDEVPTKNSNNLVKSGGVYDTKQELIKDVMTLQKDIITPVTLSGILSPTDPYSIDADGIVTPQTNEKYKLCYYPEKIKANTVINFSGTSSTSRTRRFGYVTTDPSEISDFENLQTNLLFSATRNGTWNDDFIFPEDGWLIYYYYNLDWSGTSIKLYDAVSVKDLLNEIPKKLKLVEKDVTDKSILIDSSTTYSTGWGRYSVNPTGDNCCTIAVLNPGETTVTITNNNRGTNAWYGFTLLNLKVDTNYRVEIEYTHTSENYIKTCKFQLSRTNSTSRGSSSGYNTNIKTTYEDGKATISFQHISGNLYIAFFGNTYEISDQIVITKTTITEIIDDLSTWVEDIDLVKEEVEDMNNYSRGFYVPFTESLKIIDARQTIDGEPNENFGLPIDIISTFSSTMCCSGFAPTMGYNKIKLTVSVTSANLELAGVRGVVGYDANRLPIAVIHLTELGTSATWKELTFDIPSGVEYIRLSSLTGDWQTLCKITLYLDVSTFRKDFTNEKSLTLRTYTLSTTKNKGYCVDSSSSNYGVTVKANNDNYRSCRIDVSDCDYIGMSTRLMFLSLNLDLGLGSLFVDKNLIPLPLEECCHRMIYYNGASLGAYTGFIIYKVPENAMYLRASLYSSTSTTTTITKYTTQKRKEDLLYEKIAQADPEQLDKTVREINYLNRIKQAHYRDTSSSGSGGLPVFGLLHFSDYHECGDAGEKLLYYKDLYKNYIDDMVCTGDVVCNYLDSGSASPKQYLDSGLAEESLFVLGNHDLAKESGRNENFWINVKPKDTTRENNPYWQSQKFSHDRYFIGDRPEEEDPDWRPLYEKWGVTMPEGHDDEDPDEPYYKACYWYKDYPTKKVRLIGIDSMYRFDGIIDTSYTIDELTGTLVYNTTNDLLNTLSNGLAHKTTDQETWLVNILNETLNEESSVAGYSVIFVSHYPLDDHNGFNNLTNTSSEGGMIINHNTGSPVSFSSTTGENKGAELEYRFNMRNRVASGSSYTKGSKNNIGDIIENWRINGGNYVAWISGHVHGDRFYYPTKYPELLTIVIDLAGNKRIHKGADRTEEDVFCANYCAIDTTAKHIKLVRLGLLQGRFLRINKSLCYNYNKKCVISDETNGAFDTLFGGTSVEDDVLYDFSVRDENDNMIVGFLDGHIKTKNFDSSSIGYSPYKFETTYSYEVECALPYEKTDIITPPESEVLPGDPGWPDTSSLESFIKVVPSTTPVLRSVKYIDKAALYLPTTYSQTGTPTRLVIFGRQGGGLFTSSNNFVKTDITGCTNYYYIVPYLLYLGYAVLAIDGTPDTWASEYHLNDGYVNGNYVAVRSAWLAYNKVIKQYNICKDGVFGFGYSQGGWMIMNIAELSGIPFKGVMLKAPVVDLDNYWSVSYNSQGLCTSGVQTINGVTYPARRYYMIRLYYGIIPEEDPTIQEQNIDDFEYIDDNDVVHTVVGNKLELPYEPWRWSGFNPLKRYSEDSLTLDEWSSWSSGEGYEQYSGADPETGDHKRLRTYRNMFKFLRELKMKRFCHFPVKMWISSNDSNVGIIKQVTLIQAIRNAGCYADIRMYDRGDHGWVEEDSQYTPTFNLESRIGLFTITYGSTPTERTYNLYPPTYEMALFLEKFGGNPVKYEPLPDPE